MDNVQSHYLEQIVRFHHPEKVLTTVPHLDETLTASADRRNRQRESLLTRRFAR